ncbi:hypothetical protein HPP92_013405 [Vanilla planifolia]|uniref:Uncharacterized protein n=1 Tax=Vanilla planifolia TaxID=51239 RepID=A0A835QS98_VANPL|nr:hypothetical protein HPP92_013405 [Vanilla planifolia]
MEPLKRCSWRIFARAKTKAFNLGVKAAAERHLLNTPDVCYKFSFLLRFRRCSISIKLESYDSMKGETSKMSEIFGSLAKFFCRCGRLRRFRRNAPAQKCSGPWIHITVVLVLLTMAFFST